MLPNRLVVRAYAVRGFKLWLVTRLVIAVVSLFGGQPPVAASPVGAFYIVLLCAAVNVAEIKRRHELAFLGSLGVARSQMAVLFIAPAFAAETVVQLALVTLQ